jgi:hypothetical protein
VIDSVDRAYRVDQRLDAADVAGLRGRRRQGGPLLAVAPGTRFTPVGALLRGRGDGSAGGAESRAPSGARRNSRSWRVTSPVLAEPSVHAPSPAGAAGIRWLRRGEPVGRSASRRPGAAQRSAKSSGRFEGDPHQRCSGVLSQGEGVAATRRQHARPCWPGSADILDAVRWPAIDVLLVRRPVRSRR